MALASSDELNNHKLVTVYKARAMAYDKFFGEMDLEEEQIEQRIELAKKLESVFDKLFTLASAMIMADQVLDTDYLTDYATRGIIGVINDFGIDTEYSYAYFNEFARNLSDDVVGTTEKHIDDNPWWTSNDRAMSIAENETNAIMNYVDLQQAIEDGYTKKTWVTMHDTKVRDTHKAVDGQTISIYDTFNVGGCMMFEPMDMENGTGEEVANCRCSLRFSGKKNNEGNE